MSFATAWLCMEKCLFTVSSPLTFNLNKLSHALLCCISIGSGMITGIVNSLDKLHYI